MIRFPPTHSAALRRRALWLSAFLLALLSCVDGDTVGTGGAVAIDFVPSFQVVPGDFTSGPIEAIRTRVLNAATLVPISEATQQVDPAAAQWQLSVAVNLDGASSLEVVVEVELLSGGAVAWSGRLGPLLATGGPSTAVRAVTVYRGPLDNLAVLGVSISGAPVQLLAGSSGTATATAELPQGSTANPQVFWASLDPAVATVSVDQGVATITGVAPGTATIAAAAGPQFAEVDVEILPRVQSVTVDPPSSSVVGPDQTVQFGATVVDGFGSPAPTEPVTWSSSDPSVATVDANGLATSVSAGAAQIRATAAGVTGTATLTVNDPQGAVIWLGTVDGNWDTPGNWSGGTVPGPTNDVVIRNGPNTPDLSTSGVVRTLILEAPAVLDLSDGALLVVAGDLDVQPGAVLQAESIAGSVVQMSGTGVSLRGAIEPILSVSGDVTLAGTVQVSSDVVVSGTGARLDIDGNLMNVSGGFTTASDGVLVMNGVVAATLAVDGDIVFGGGSTNGLLTAGTIRARGDFIAGGSATSFAPAGVHAVVFEGASDFIVSFLNPGATGQRFAYAWFDRVGTTFIESDFFVLVDMRVLRGTVDASAYAASLQGRLQDPGGGFSHGELHLVGNVVEMPADVAGPVYVDGIVDWPNNSTIAGDVFIQSYLGVAATLLTVTGSVTADGDINVPAGSELSIGGSLTLASGINFDIDGVVDALGGCFDNGANITGSGSHPCGSPYDFTWVGGDSGGANDWANANNWAPAGVPTGSDVVFVPTAPIDPPVLTDDATVGGLFIGPDAGLDLGGFTLTVNGDLDAGNTIINGLTVIAGAGSVLQGRVDDLRVDVFRTLSGPLDVSGDLETRNILVIGGQTATVSGNLLTQTSQGRLDMRNAADVVDVEGDVLFDGGSGAGYLTQGQLLVAGNFTVAGTSSTASFYASGSHQVVLDGAAGQSVTLSNPGLNFQHFHRLSILNTASGVTFGSDVVVTGGLAVDPAATLDASDDVVSVGGAFDISPLTSLFQVVVIGDLTSISTNVTADLLVNVAMTVPNSFTLNGDLTTSQTLVVGGFTVTVNGNLTTQGSSGRLDMRVAGGEVNVAGNALFDGGSEAGYLTQGRIFVAGDFTATATNSAASYYGSGNHEVALDGTVTQTVTFSSPGTNLQHFNRVTIINTGTVRLGSDVVATGGFDVNVASTLDASNDVISVGGAFNISPTTLLFQVVVIGDLASISNTVTASEMFVNAALTVPNSFTLNGDLSVSNTLVVGAFTVTVNGDVTTQGSAGRLDMRVAGGLVDVDGNVLFDGGTEAGYLTLGSIEVTGNFTANASNSVQSFYGTGTHRVVLDGDLAQTVSFSTPGTASQRFQNLSLQNLGSGVTFLSDFYVLGDFDVGADVLVDASDDALYVGGSFVDSSGGILLQDLVIIGDLTATSASVTADVTVAASYNMPSSFAVTGNVLATNTLAIGANTLTVSGNLTTQGANGRLDMRNAVSVVDVAGDVLFNGATLTGYLTLGELRVAGDFTATASSTTSFVGTGSHTVILDGTAAQAVSFSSPATNLQRLQNLTISNFGATVTFLSDVVVMGQFQTFAGVSVNAADDALSVGGAFLDGSDGIQLQDLIIVGDLTATSGSVAANVTVNALFNMPNNFSVTGNVVTNNTLAIGANTLLINGNLSTATSTGRLDMRSASSLVQVTGNVSFDGASEIGYLTSGDLQMLGSFFAGSTFSPTSFVGTSTHTVSFLGTALQSVNLSNPGPTGQRFQNVLHENFNAGLGLGTSMVVMGTFTADDVEMTRTGPLGTVLDVRGTLDVQFTTLTGLPLRLESSVAGPSQSLSDVVFQSMSPTQVQLYVELPALGVNSPFFVPNMIFDSPAFTTGAHLQTERLSGSGVMVFELFNAAPAGGQGNVVIQGANTSVVWP